MQWFIFLYLIGIVLPIITTRCHCKTKIKLLSRMLPHGTPHPHLFFSKKVELKSSKMEVFKKWMLFV